MQLLNKEFFLMESVDESLLGAPQFYGRSQNFIQLFSANDVQASIATIAIDSDD